MPIDPASLSNPAYYGLACVVCGRPFGATEQPDRVVPGCVWAQPDGIRVGHRGRHRDERPTR